MPNFKKKNHFSLFCNSRLSFGAENQSQLRPETHIRTCTDNKSKLPLK